MGFLYNETKREPRPSKPRSAESRKAIPIHSLQQLGCSVCPREKDGAKRRTPKMEPTGTRSPSVYLLGTGPNEDEDDAGEHWAGKAGKAILSKFSRSFARNELRFGHLTQCMPPQGADGLRDLAVDVVEVECCRPRVVRDIEESKPRLIVGVGDIPLRWATGMAPKDGSALLYRGRLFVVKVGTHVCWFFSILWPNYLMRKGYGKSEYELALEHDIKRIEDLINHNQLGDARNHYHAAPYDKGIEIITGQEAGDFQRLERGLADVADEPDSAIDIEANGLRVFNLKKPLLLTAAVGTFERTVAFSIDHPEGWGAQSRIDKVMALFGEFLLWSGRKTAHHLGMEMEWLSYFYGGRILRLTEWGDTMAMAHTVDERTGTHSLRAQTVLYFDFDLKAQSRVDVKRQNWWLEYPLDEILRYNGMDTKWTDLLRWRYEQILADEDQTQRDECERKVRLAPTLVLMENRGLPVDTAYAAKLRKEVTAKIDKVEDELRRCPEVRTFGQRFGSFSPSKPEHVLKLLKDVCQRDEVKKQDRDGNESMSSDEGVLSSLPKKEVPSAPLILEHRGLSKLESNYLEAIASGRILSVDGRLHSKYSSMRAETGRLAAEDPAVQNWPARKYKQIRGAIVSEQGGWILKADYGQIEARCFGMASEDQNLVRALWTDFDIHGHWASRFVKSYGAIKDQIVEEFSIDWDEKGLKTLRQEAKNKWVFPMFFGAAAKSCAENLGMPVDIMERLKEEFWDEFRGVKRWQEKLMSFYERHLYVETLTGRRRRGAMSKNQILNHPIQGTAFDIVGASMNALSERAMEEDDEEMQQVLQIHDDDTFLISDATIERKIPIIVEELCLHRFDWINVPILVEVEVGTRWSELQKYGNYRSDQLFNIPNPFAKKEARR